MPQGDSWVWNDVLLSAQREPPGNAGAHRVLVRSALLPEILRFSESHPQVEIGGFLLGRHDGRCVTVRNFIPARNARSRGASLKFTHETWADAGRRREAEFPDDEIVGWHHTHPNLGVFLSASDRFIQESFFREPWQIAMVVDPQRRELAFFQWLDGKITPCGFEPAPD